jgi:hypothetical protein
MHKNALLSLSCQRLTEQELSEYWNMKRNTLQKWRSSGVGPIYIKIGAKAVYPIESIMEYERNRTFKSSGERVSLLLQETINGKNKDIFVCPICGHKSVIHK